MNHTKYEKYKTTTLGEIIGRKRKKYKNNLNQMD
jgi:hypothetical protein